MNKNTSQGQIFIPFARSSWFLPDDSACRFTRELWWTNQEFSFVDIIIPPWFSMLLYHVVMNNRPVGGRSSEMQSYPIDMMMMMMIIVTISMGGGPS
jgi:hypothetical protein